jgi:hypothetical protein
VIPRDFALRALKVLESIDDYSSYCPRCHGNLDHLEPGHTADCDLVALIAELREGVK